jgi:hypothetical protein
MRACREWSPCAIRCQVTPASVFVRHGLPLKKLWRRWKAGQSLHEIGRAFGNSHSSIRCGVSLHGGFVPAVRRRSLLALTLPEREDISRGIASGSSIREIAKLLDRAASTVSREVARHGGRPEYRANEADTQAWKSAMRPKPCLLAIHEKLQEIVASKLMLDCSPEQISGWLQTQYPADESMRVSHETIYRRRVRSANPRRDGSSVVPPRVASWPPARQLWLVHRRSGLSDPAAPTALSDAGPPRSQGNSPTRLAPAHSTVWFSNSSLRSSPTPAADS